MISHPVVDRTAAHASRLDLLAKEKAFTRARDDLARARRTLPWVRMDKRYDFDTPSGTLTLADLFAGRSQLIVQHFMFSPDWDEGCVGCSFSADHVDGALPHIQARDASFVAVSRAPLAKIEAFKRRMGWRFDWISSFASDFNYDFNVSFRRDDIAAGRAEYNFRPLDFEIEDLSGHSIFLKQAATYFTLTRHSRAAMKC